MLCGINDSELTFITCRIPWDEFSKILTNMADVMMRGSIPPEEKPAYQDAAASLHNAAGAVKFLRSQWPAIRERIVPKPPPVQKTQDASELAEDHDEESAQC